MPVHPSTVLGAGVRIAFPELVNLYGCELGPQTRLGRSLKSNAAR